MHFFFTFLTNERTNTIHSTVHYFSFQYYSMRALNRLICISWFDSLVGSGATVSKIIFIYIKKKKLVEMACNCRVVLIRLKCQIDDLLFGHVGKYSTMVNICHMIKQVAQNIAVPPKRCHMHHFCICIDDVSHVDDTFFFLSQLEIGWLDFFPPYYFSRWYFFIFYFE